MKPFVTRFHKSIDKRQNSVMWQTATISHQDLNDFGNSFYDMNRVKIIPDNIVQYLTPLSLAIWIMDDGSLNSNINMRIATMCFTEKEHYMLQDYLYVIFDLKSKVMSYGKNISNDVLTRKIRKNYQISSDRMLFRACNTK